jgi:phage baseplate assembly protein gpV
LLDLKEKVQIMVDRVSGLVLYSLGIVVEDKPEGTDKIKVTPVEEISMADGLLADVKIKYDVNMPDHKGIKRQNAIEGDVSLIATWLPFGHSNRITSPDVYRNETVMIFRMADTDQYYWTTIMREPSIRRLETVNYGFSNLYDPPDGKKSFDKSTSYWLEVSTRHKYVHLHTANNDGEPFMYDLRIDTRVGTVTLTDDVGNNIILSSPDNKLTINTNADVEVNTENCVVNASTKADINTKDATINASSATTVNSPSIKLNGDVTIAGSFSTSGGDVTLTGGSITANGEDLNTDLT